MRALVVYESMFGTNRDLAHAIAEGLSASATVEVVEVGDAPTRLANDLDLLVVGGPNHQFGLSRPSSRAQAAQETEVPLVSRSIGLREWLAELDVDAGVSTVFAVFDTRVDVRVLQWMDRAARTITKRLGGYGLRALAPGECFRVTATTGPLADGELARAREWHSARHAGRGRARGLTPTTFLATRGAVAICHRSTTPRPAPRTRSRAWISRRRRCRCRRRLGRTRTRSARRSTPTPPGPHPRSTRSLRAWSARHRARRPSSPAGRW